MQEATDKRLNGIVVDDDDDADDVAAADSDVDDDLPTSHCRPVNDVISQSQV